MKVSFDPDIKLAGIGLVPWTRLGLERWLPNYAVACFFGWDRGNQATRPQVYALADQVSPLPTLPKLNTPSLLAEQTFQNMLSSDLAGYDFLTYKPATIPPELRNRKFLMTDKAQADRYENKAWFREQLGDLIPFPPYRIMERSQLTPDQQTFDAICAGRSSIVIQDEQLSGGKGTAIVYTFEQYCAALEALGRLSSHHKVVVSDLVPKAKERSIQCVVTKFGVFTGPLQRQIVAHPRLANLQVPDGDKFCGAQILADDQNTPHHRQAIDIAQKIGQRMHNEGYRGIFGVDFLVSEDDLFVLEANPRITGVTPLLTRLYASEQSIPFYLLHVLELGGYNYQVEDTAARFDNDGAMLMLHSLANDKVTITHSPASGTYKVIDDTLVWVSQGINPAQLAEDEFVFEEYMPPGMVVKPGGRLGVVYCNRKLLEKANDSLYNSTVQIVEALYHEINTQPVYN